MLHRLSNIHIKEKTDEIVLLFTNSSNHNTGFSVCVIRQSSGTRILSTITFTSGHSKLVTCLGQRSPLGSTIADSDDHCPNKGLLSLKWGHLSRTQGSVYTHDLCPGSEISRQSCLGTTIVDPILSWTVCGRSNPVLGQLSGASHDSLATVVPMCSTLRKADTPHRKRQ